MLPFERPEQGLDMIQEAMTHYELTPGEDFYIALNLAGHEIFDYVSLVLIQANTLNVALCIL